MTKLSTSIEPDCKHFTLPCKNSNMLISRCNVHHIHVIKKTYLSWRISLLGITLIQLFKNRHAYLDQVLHKNSIRTHKQGAKKRKMMSCCHGTYLPDYFHWEMNYHPWILKMICDGGCCPRKTDWCHRWTNWSFVISFHKDLTPLQFINNYILQY